MSKLPLSPGCGCCPSVCDPLPTITVSASDCCGAAISGASIAITGPAPSTDVVGTGTTSGTGGVAPIAVPGNGDYTVSSDIPGSSPKVVTIADCQNATVNIGFPTATPPFVLSDGTGNDVVIAKWKTSNNFIGVKTVAATIHTFPGDTPFVPNCGFEATLLGSNCFRKTAGSTFNIPVAFWYVGCTLSMFAFGCADTTFPFTFRGLREGDAEALGDTLSGQLDAGGTFSAPIYQGLNVANIFESPLGSCSPLMASVPANFAPTTDQINGWCINTNTHPGAVYFFSSLYPSGATFTLVPQP